VCGPPYRKDTTMNATKDLSKVVASWEWCVTTGWRDQMPPPMAELFKLHDGQRKRGVLCLEAHSHAKGLQDASVLSIERHSPEIDGVLDAFSTLNRFLEHLHRDEVDQVSLIFLNLAATTFPHDPRPDEAAYASLTIDMALSVFCKSVAGSIDPLQFRSKWSVCEWVMLSCTRKT
jgi:hypothetical protein